MADVIRCTAGTDRTGFLSAMILHALRVEPSDILADHLSSGARMNHAITEATRRLITERVGTTVSEDAMVAITAVRAAYRAESIEAIEARYGSVEGYLRDANGLTVAFRAEIAGRLLV